MTLPFLMTLISTLVPPASKKMPSDTFSYIRAPATPAARPESMVRMGRLRTLLDAHDPAVAARMIIRSDSILVSPDRLLGHVGGLHHLGDEAGVDHGGTGAHLEAVELADLMAAGAVEPHLLRLGDDLLLVGRVIHAERLAGHNDLGALIAQAPDGLGRGILAENLAVEEGVVALEVLVGASSISPTAVSPFAPWASMPVAMPSMPTLATSPLQQGVGGLGGAVGDEGDVAGAMCCSSISSEMIRTTPWAHALLVGGGNLFLASTS